LKNRRNYYRILHVQPEAPAEIIRASYRSLMSNLRQHPDLGGDHDTAALINEAYAVLGDPQRRREYDRTLRARTGQSRPGAPAGAGAARGTQLQTAQGRSGTAGMPRWSPVPTESCPFCEARVDFPMTGESRCPRCDSPLAPLHGARRAPPELFGRRATTRVAKTGLVWLFPDWPHPGIQARLKNLSPHGFSMDTALALKPGQVVKFESAIVSGIAEIVSVRHGGSLQTAHARFLTAYFAAKTGGLVSVTV
jgi:hypothetical protein